MNHTSQDGETETIISSLKPIEREKDNTAVHFSIVR